MTKIDQTIDELVAEAGPVRAAPPWESFLTWCSLTLAATLLLVHFGELRADLSVQLRNPLFLLEVATLLLVILTAALAALTLGYPDLRQKPWLVALPLPFVTVYAALMLYRSLTPEATTILPEDAHNDFNCIICITTYSLVPGFWMFRTLRRHATTHPQLAGGLSLLMAASLGLLVLKFAEANDSAGHLIIWHLVPVALLGVLGAFIGKKFLRW